MTALLIALLKKFETLRFRKMSDESLIHVDVPPINLWRVLTITLTFVGAEYLFGVASALLPESWLGGWQLVVLFGGVLLTYFVVPILVARAFVNLRYSTVAFAVLLTQIFSFLVAVVRLQPVVAEVFNESGPRPAIGVQGALCLVFEIVALVGVRVGLLRRDTDALGESIPNI